MTSSHSAVSVTQRGMLVIALAALLWGTVGIATRLVYDLATTNAPVSYTHLDVYKRQMLLSLIIVQNIR